MGEILLPGQVEMKMSLPALIKIAEYILSNKNEMKPGQTFTITGTDKKKLVITFQK